jgi:hypothetical protein
LGALQSTDVIPGGLINAWFKTERAKKHLDELREALDAYFDADKKPYSVTRENEEQGTYTLHVEIEEPHVWVFLIAGDVFSCLRAALDHAVWRIASLHVARPSNKIQFPIIAVNDDKGKERFQEQTAGIGDRALTVIESFQPYNRPTDIPLRNHPLWCLAKMNNIDKHRRIAVHPTVALMEPEIKPYSITGDNDRKTFRFRVDEAIPNPRINVEVIFGSEADGVAVTLADLYALHAFVADTVLVRLAPFDP